MLCSFCFIVSYLRCFDYVFLITKYNMQLCWRIYQTRIFRENKTHIKLFGKKYSLIVEPRDLIKRMTERALFHSFGTSRLLLWSLNWNSRLLFVIMIFCCTSTTCSWNLSKIITCSKQWKIAWRPDLPIVLCKKLTYHRFGIYWINDRQTNELAAYPW